MKQLFSLALFAMLAALVARGQGLDDDYVQIFNLIQQADAMSSTEPAQALAKYVQAQVGLQRLQRGNPTWNPRVINFRLNYVTTRIAALSPGSSAAKPSSAVPGAAPPGSPTPGAAPSSSPAVPEDVTRQLSALQVQVGQLQADKGALENKLKEALAMRPAELDPGELASAQQKIKSLQQENDLLKVALDKEKSKTVAAGGVAAFEKISKELEESNRQLATQTELASRLAKEKSALQARIAALSADPEMAAALRAENQLLKKQLATLKAGPAAAGDETARALAQTRTQMAALESDRELLRLEKAALENRVRQLSSTTIASSVLPPPGPAADANHIKQLEQERDTLQRQLAAANKELYGRKGKGSAARVEELENQLAIARARLEIFEARSVPYTAEELALFKRPAQMLAESDPHAGKKSVRELPPGSARLVAEAQTYFAARQFDRAEQAYLQVVRQDQKSVPALANLAAIQVEDNHLEAAEMNVKQALALDPNDAYSLSVLGNLKFRQGKFDDALDALSRAAKLDPQNPEIQNYLGLTLSEKGLRGPAETALRKAIQLQPDYASAHNNLAVIYITQTPPAIELARWHYQRALAAGHPKNPELEKLLEGKK
jgi:tetratricopeptide (TPR) repeat protein